MAISLQAVGTSGKQWKAVRWSRFVESCVHVAVIILVSQILGLKTCVHNYLVPTSPAKFKLLPLSVTGLTHTRYRDPADFRKRQSQLKVIEEILISSVFKDYFPSQCTRAETVKSRGVTQRSLFQLKHWLLLTIYCVPEHKMHSIKCVWVSAAGSECITWAWHPVASTFLCLMLKGCSLARFNCFCGFGCVWRHWLRHSQPYVQYAPLLQATDDVDSFVQETLSSWVDIRLYRSGQKLI